MIGKDLVECRKLFGLSQQEMADMLGYKIRAYQNLEIATKQLRRSIRMACCAHASGITKSHTLARVKQLLDEAPHVTS